MTITEAQTSAAIDLADRLFEAAIGTLELFGVFLGTQLGLYDQIVRAGDVTEDTLAERAGIHPRYSREWLEQQAVAGIITVDDATASPEARRYSIPAEHIGTLVDPEDPSHVAPFGSMVVGIAQALDLVVEAFRSGEGVAYPNYGEHFRNGQGGINRPAFTSDLVAAWLPAAGLSSRLASGATVLDIGMGHGWSSVAVKRSWPTTNVIGIDSDEASVVEARDRAAVSGVDVRFEVVDASNPLESVVEEQVDVALVLEALHDMSRPVDALRSIRERLAPDGVVIVADEAVADEFVAPGDELERMMYGWSISHCLPVAMAEPDSAAIGTAIRHHTVVEIAAEAGYSSCEVVDVDGGFFRIYALRP